MNKYIQSYKTLEDAVKVGLAIPNSRLVLQNIRELVYKEQPRHPKMFKEEWGNEAICPVCNETLEGEEPYRCVNCGQRIKWEDDDEY